MAKTTAQLLHEQNSAPNFTSELIAGRHRWDLMSPWPRQDPAERAIGDNTAAALRQFLAERVDPSAVDASGQLPDGLVDDLKAHGWFSLSPAAEHGGRALSPYNIFRVVETAARHTLPVALTLAIEAAIGVGAYLPVLPRGPLRDLIAARVAEGVVSGTADTEPSGAANQTRLTTATPTEDGRAYRLNGEKVHIGNAPIAELLWTTATVREAGGDRIRTFLLDTSSPGVEIGVPHQFMGLRGFPNGPVRLTDVVAPAEHMFVEEGYYEGRLTPSLSVLLSVGRLYLICAPSLAISRGCLEAAREFANRRRIDGRRLGEFDEVQRQVAASLADVFAIESIAEWSLLSTATSRVNPTLEQNLAKNISSLACWRIVDRTMSLLASEGFETAESKASRGVPATPMERLFRDARGLRISGGVDFQLDNWLSQMIVFADRYPPGRASGDPAPETGAEPDSRNLSPANAAHLRAVTADVRSFGNTCQELAAAHPDFAELARKEHLHVALGAICTELVAMSAALARASHLSHNGDGTAQRLADIFCVAARSRLAERWRQLSPDAKSGTKFRGVPDYAGVSDGWLHSDRDL